jgi:hypothetical protein
VSYTCFSFLSRNLLKMTFNQAFIHIVASVSGCFHAHSIDEIVDWVQHTLVRYVEPSKVVHIPVPRFGHSFNLQFLREVTRSVIAVSWVLLFWVDFQTGRRSIRDRALCDFILRASITSRALLATIQHCLTHAARCPPMALPKGFYRIQEW